MQGNFLGIYLYSYFFWKVKNIWSRIIPAVKPASARIIRTLKDCFWADATADLPSHHCSQLAELFRVQGSRGSRSAENESNPERNIWINPHSSSCVSFERCWLVVWHIFYFSIYWDFHHPKWLLNFSEGLTPETCFDYAMIIRNLMLGWDERRFLITVN